MKKSRISLKPCPFCGASVSAFRGIKQVVPDAVEAENPIKNFKRRGDDG